jgi:very-short-patch-repair endonuclease
MARPPKPTATLLRARKLRMALSLPEALLWRELKSAPTGSGWRKQHAAGPYVLDFFCARVNLAVELDGIAHDMGDRPERDSVRDRWLLAHRIDTLRIPAAEVLRDPRAVASRLFELVQSRYAEFGKAAR